MNALEKASKAIDTVYELNDVDIIESDELSDICADFDQAVSILNDVISRANNILIKESNQ